MTEEQLRALLIATLVSPMSWGAACKETLANASQMADAVLISNKLHFTDIKIAEAKKELNEHRKAIHGERASDAHAEDTKSVPGHHGQGEASR